MQNGNVLDHARDLNRYPSWVRNAITTDNHLEVFRSFEETTCG